MKESQSPVPIPHSRVGLGYDSHRFAPGGPLILGGIRIPVEFSLAGHSDGDAVAHAVTDAVLGAAALGDIGEMFPDTNPDLRGADSMEMLRAAVARVRAAGYAVVNADVVVVTETPRVGPYRDAMRASVAEALGVSMADVSIKGKSNERMGWVGRGEGLACLATVAVTRRVASA
ncbi:MAG: 2-C-methyl-D-erythritol 2,4-cyclodiphosphate synthase [Gemmatimonadaceae bacterium]|nr:2-C-methyl-D-erythritol 2,4-cyclodiphosphate synthase [Gemmatimonadaceae bacterium]